MANGPAEESVGQSQMYEWEICWQWMGRWWEAESEEYQGSKGTMDISAPVSMRKERPAILVMHNRVQGLHGRGLHSLNAAF